MPSQTSELSRYFTPNPTTLRPEDELDRAIELFSSSEFRHLPVVRDSAVVGMLSDRDVDLATGWMSIRERMGRHSGPKIGGARLVSEVMRSPVQCASPSDDVREAARRLAQEHIGALPVVERGELVGIVTATDVLRLIVERCREAPVSPICKEPAASLTRRKLTTVAPDTSLEEAVDACIESGVRHLPVVEDGLLCGIISDRDLRRGLARSSISDSRAQSEGRYEMTDCKVEQLMSRVVVSMEPEGNLAEAAALMLEGNFSSVPLATGQKLVGLLTHTDLLHRFAEIE